MGAGPLRDVSGSFFVGETAVTNIVFPYMYPRQFELKMYSSMGTGEKGKKARELELLRMPIERLRKTLANGSGSPTSQEVEKLHTLKLIEAILAIEFPQEIC
jgi:hypothetical protein